MMVRQSKIGSSLESKELVVFDILRDSKCTECGKELGKGDFLFMEGKHPVCLSCADFDHLIYLPRGDAALTRRAKKYSPGARRTRMPCGCPAACATPRTGRGAAR